jgi:hypothetical protein
MPLAGLLSCYENTVQLCQNVSNAGAIAKVERAAAFYRKLVKEKIVQPNSNLKEILAEASDAFEATLREGALGAFMCEFAPSINHCLPQLSSSSCLTA